MLKPEFTGQFKRDYKLAIKRECNPKKLTEVVTLLCKEEPLPLWWTPMEQVQYEDGSIEEGIYESQIIGA